MIQRRVLSLGLAGFLTLTVASPSSPHQTSGQALPLDDVLNRAVAAVASFEREFAAVVADEYQVQQSDSTFTKSRREMRSDLLLVRVPGRDGWLPFRDVYEVDGRSVRDRSERLQKLFIEAPETAVNAATQISNESSRYNIGAVIRTINVPTFGLMLLRPEYVKRFEFKKRSEEMVGDVLTWRVAFAERVRPTVVRTLPRGGNDVPLEGSFWIVPQSGRVIKTLVKTIGTPDPGVPLVVTSNQTLMRVEVTFAPSDALGLWVPERMAEWARAENRAEVSGTATYSRFRRFAVKTAETFQPPPGR